MFSYIQSNDVLNQATFEMGPGVNTFVNWGSSVDTPVNYTFKEDFVKSQVTPSLPPMFISFLHWHLLFLLPWKLITPAFPALANCSGDGVVPARSSQRGNFFSSVRLLWDLFQATIVNILGWCSGIQWGTPLEKAGKKLYYKEYRGLYHASCLFPSAAGSPQSQCFLDFLNLLVNATAPQPGPWGPSAAHGK